MVNQGRVEGGSDLPPATGIAGEMDGVGVAWW